MKAHEELQRMFAENPSMMAHCEKLIAARVISVLDDPDLLRIVKEHGSAPLRRSSAMYGLDDFLRENHVRGSLAVEIGTCNGITAIILARYFDRVVTIDIEEHAYVKSILRSHHNVTAFVAKDNQEKYDMIGLLNFDFAFVDGDHARDTYSDFESVKRCGRVLFHEAWQAQKPVWNLVRSLPKNEVKYGAFNMALWTKS